MAFLKKFGAGGTKKKPGRESVPVRATEPSSLSPKPTQQEQRVTDYNTGGGSETAAGSSGSTPLEARRYSEENVATENLPSRTRRDRNLSISRSGRHKFTKKNRASLLSNDLYSPDKAGASGPPQSSSTSSSNATASSAAGAVANCRDMGSLSDQSLHLAGQPTAV